MGTYERCQCGRILENIPMISLPILNQHYQTFLAQNFAFISNPNHYENNLQPYVENDITIDNIDNELINYEIINMNYSQSLLNNNYELNERSSHSRNKRKERHVRAKSKTNFKLFCLPHGDLTPKIPRIVANLHASLKKSTCFDNDLDDDGIKKAVEELFQCLKNRKWRFFRCKSTSDLEIAPKPANGWSISELNRIAGSRKKLYLGTIDGPIQSLTPPLLI